MVVWMWSFIENALECSSMNRRWSDLVDRRCDYFFAISRTKDGVIYVKGGDCYLLSDSISCGFFLSVEIWCRHHRGRATWWYRQFFPSRPFLRLVWNLIPRKNPILSSICESYFLILRKTELVCSASNNPSFILENDLYFSWNIVWVDSRLKKHITFWLRSTFASPWIISCISLRLAYLYSG